MRTINLILIILIHGGIIFAQESNQINDLIGASKVYDLGEVEVTEAKIDENRTAEIVNDKDLKDMNLKDLAQSLSYTSGVVYSPASGQRGESSFNIRGFSEQQVGIFIDGIPMYSIYDKQTDWGQFVLFDASRVQISKGYTSVLYGPNTLGGAINLVTKKPVNKLELEFRAQYQTPNQHYEYASIGTNLGNFYASFSFSNMQRNFYKLSNNFKPTPFQPTKYRQNSYYDNQRFNVKLGFTPNLSDEYSINLIYSQGKKGGVPSTKVSSIFWDWPSYDKITAYFLSNTSFNDFIVLTSKVFFDTFYNELHMKKRLLEDGSLGGGGPSGTSIYNDWTLGANIGLNFNFTPNDYFKFSTLVKSDNHKNEDGAINPSTSQSDVTGYIAGEYTRIFLENLKGSFSLSYSRNDVLLAETKSTAGHIINDTKTNLYGIGAQAILYYDVLDNFDMYGTIGKKDNIPTLKDRYSTTWGERVPNPNLRTESAINFELGLNYHPLDSLHLGAAVFYNNLNDMIVKQDLDNSACSAGNNCYRLRNASKGNSYGFEGNLNYELMEILLLNLNYTYMKKEAKDDSVITEFPNHIVNFRIKYNPINSLDLILGARYTQGSETSAGGGKSSTIYITSPDVFLVDIRAVYKITDFEIALGIDNVTDRNYWYRYGYELEGRRYYIELGYKY